MTPRAIAKEEAAQCLQRASLLANQRVFVFFFYYCVGSCMQGKEHVISYSRMMGEDSFRKPWKTVFVANQRQSPKNHPKISLIIPESSAATSNAWPTASSRVS